MGDGQFGKQTWLHYVDASSVIPRSKNQKLCMIFIVTESEHE